MVFLLVKLMDANPLFVDGEVGEAGIDPATCVVVVNSVFFDLDGLVGVAAEDAVGMVLARIVKSSDVYKRQGLWIAC